MTMPEKWRKTFQAWSKLENHKRLVEETLRKVGKYAGKYNCVVSYSGGKDSTVLLHLCLQVDPDITVFHWDHGPWLMPRSIEQQIIQNARSLGAKNLIVATSNMLNKPEIRWKWRVWYLVFWNELARLRKEHGWEINFVALREEESIRRRRKISRHKEIWEQYPIAEWTWLDVWAWIVSNNLPYPSFYDKYAKLLGYDKTRLVTMFDLEFEKFGTPYLDGFLYPQYRHGI